MKHIYSTKYVHQNMLCIAIHLLSSSHGLTLLNHYRPIGDGEYFIPILMIRELKYREVR